jgi:hypothetical protein
VSLHLAVSTSPKVKNSSRAFKVVKMPRLISESQFYWGGRAGVDNIAFVLRKWDIPSLKARLES